MLAQIRMARLNGWISPNLLHALGWTLVHSLWQVLAIAALAAAAMALVRRPSARYLIGVGALVAMLAAPVATFFLLTKSDAPAAIAIQAAAMPPTAMPDSAAPAIALGNSVSNASDGFALVPSAPVDLPLQRLWPWLVGAWLFGVTLFSLRFAGGFLLLEHRRRTQSFPPDAHILALCRQVQQQLGLTRAIRYLECSWLEAPAAMGWLRPVILLPVTALTGLDEAQLRAVIAHELAHIRRWDFQVNLFQIFAETLLFYHPALWWLNRRIRAERELCCDEIAVAVTGNRFVYARALAAMAEWKSAPALAIAANRGSIARRILYVLDENPLSLRQRAMGLTGGMMFLAAALIAANTLFGIAYPARASESPQPVVASAPVTSPKQTAPSTPSESEAPVIKDPPPARLASAGAANSITANILPAKTAAATPQALSVTPAPTLDVSPQVSSHDAPTSQAVVALNNPPAPPASLETDTAVPPVVAQSQTKPALACIFGLGPKGCAIMFGAAASQMTSRTIIRNGFTPNYLSAKLVWQTDSGDEVWDVKFGELRDWQEQTYVISKPDADGKIRRIAVLLGAPDHLCANYAANLATGIRINANCDVLFPATPRR